MHSNKASFQHTISLVQSGKLIGFSQDKEGIWQYRERIFVLEGNGLRGRILEEAHKSEFTVHPRINEMYQDLKRMLWWPSMKSDIASFVNKCLDC